jgi:hypothetical protein
MPTSKHKNFKDQLPRNPPPPRRCIGIVIGVVAFGWGRWVLGRDSIAEGTAIFGLIALFGGVILALWSIWFLHGVHLMKPEYQEGPKAKEEFERTMVGLFQAPRLDSKNQALRQIRGLTWSGY